MVNHSAASLKPGNGQQGRVDLVGQHLAVERRPEPQDEPPAGDGQDEADASVEDAALPDVVAAGARHGRDQAGIDDHLEDGEDRADDDAGRQAATQVVAVREDEQTQRNQVDRERGVDEGIEDRPCPHQPTRLANEQGCSTHLNLLCTTSGRIPLARETRIRRHARQSILLRRNAPYNLGANLLSRACVRAGSSSRGEHVVAHLIGFQLDHGSVQHSLLVHAARIDAQRAFVLACALAFMDMAVQSPARAGTCRSAPARHGCRRAPGSDRRRQAAYPWSAPAPHPGRCRTAGCAG